MFYFNHFLYVWWIPGKAVAYPVCVELLELL